MFVNESYFWQPLCQSLTKHANTPSKWPHITQSDLAGPDTQGRDLLTAFRRGWFPFIKRLRPVMPVHHQMYTHKWNSVMSMFLSVLNKSLYFIVLYCKHSVKRTATVFNENASALQCTVALILYDHLFLSCFCFVKHKTWQHLSIMLFVTVTFPDPISTNF